MTKNKFQLSNEQLKVLKAISDVQHRPIKQIIELMIEKYLKDNDELMEAIEDIALYNAIKEGEEAEYIDTDTFIDRLNSRIEQIDSKS